MVAAPDRLTEILAPYCRLFGRADQARWFTTYIRGLLGPAERKSIEPLARSLSDAAEPRMTSAVQALQHFIQKSPWDEQVLLSHYRARLLQRLEPMTKSRAAFVLHTVTFLKSGRHSVGVQRQAISSTLRKANCQRAIALSYVDRSGHWPLALRLFLPPSWLRDADRVRATGVPEAFRTPSRKAHIALDLLDSVRREGWPDLRVVADTAIASVDEFGEGLANRGLNLSEEPVGARLLASAISDFETMRRELGLDHYEGRSWRGWHHHVSLVILAQAVRQFVEMAS